MQLLLLLLFIVQSFPRGTNKMAARKSRSADFVVVGGGVAGVCCCQTLAEKNPKASIILLAAKDVIKLVTSHRKITRALEEVSVEERPSFTLQENYENISVINDLVVEIDHKSYQVKTAQGLNIGYKKLCLCTGAKPHLIDFENENILGIRDVDSVAELQKKLKTAKRIMIVGNGGIALELVYELLGCEVIWAIKDDAIGNVFLDKAASEFLLPMLNEENGENHQRKADTVIFKRRKYAAERETADRDSPEKVPGGALGPDWCLNACLQGEDDNLTKRKVHVETKCEVKRIVEENEFNKLELSCSNPPKNFSKQQKWPQYVELTNDEIHGVDFIVSATGVKPNVDFKIKGGELALDKDGGIKVGENMRSNLTDIYAAGDVCTASWELAPHWFQMRLWTQAYQMGVHAANCMMLNTAHEQAILDFCFEMFAHVTSFFGHKLCLLGKYNAQGLDGNYELLVRYTKGQEYVKVVLKDGRMMGALLLGETDLEETFENLILNQMDLSRFGDDLLNPDIEIDEFFD